MKNDKRKMTFEEFEKIYYSRKNINERTKELIQELRKRNPYKFFNLFETARIASIAWDNCCDELEKMRKEKG